MTAADTLQALSQQTKRNGGGVSLPRRGSFTDVEQFCLKALLLDFREPPLDPKLGCIDAQGYVYEKYRHPSSPRKNKFDDNVLFQIPFSSATADNNNNNNNARASHKFGRHEKKILGLWQAHEDGVHHVVMNKRKASTASLAGQSSRQSSRFDRDNPQSAASQEASDEYEYNNVYDCEVRSKASEASSMSGGGALTARSDMEVRPELKPDDDHSDDSWDDDAGGFIHYNAWEVLNDEYAEDFGFDYTETINSIQATLHEEENIPRTFKILGTSAVDKSAQPHVLSPPLMDSLLNYVPDSVSMENYWMKFSLIRDGASLYTLKQYVKAARYTLLAIETTKGEVFGAFVSHTWRNHPTFYGNAPAFLWRMQHNRRTPCHSLFEQAQMESEVDVFQSSGLNDLFQVCDEHRLAIGGGKLVPDWELFSSGNTGPETRDPEGDLQSGQNFGFGIALDEDLLSGTTSPCGTFRNLCLVDPMSKGEVFQIANLEVWAFTPCADVKSAERMEMTRYFVEESIRSVASSQTGSSRGGSTTDIYSNPFNSREEFQRDFYRRIGHNQPKDNDGLRSFVATATGLHR